jgi:hypothetical protein
MSEYYWPVKTIKKTKKIHRCLRCNLDIKIGDSCTYNRILTYDMDTPEGYYFHIDKNCYDNQRKLF